MTDWMNLERSGLKSRQGRVSILGKGNRMSKSIKTRKRMENYKLFAKV